VTSRVPVVDRSFGSRNRRPLLLLLLATVVIGSVGAALYQRESQRVREQNIEELVSIARLKVGQIDNWRDERLMDVAFGSHGPYFIDALADWDNDRVSDRQRAVYESRLANYLAMLHYDASFLVDADGRVAFAAVSGSRDLDPAEREAMRRALQSRRAVLSEFFVLESLGVRLSAAAPVVDGDRLAGFFVLRRAPEYAFFPLLREWPTQSRSAETVLVTRHGDWALFVASSRRRATAPMSPAVPFTSVPAASVATVQSGRPVTVEAQDRRGRGVIARIEPVLGTAWMVVTKVDRDEILGETRYRGASILGFALLGTLLSALSVLLLVNRRQ
jgi:hypothetical protein